jgi:glycosyltransferase involved in cell wall biosynthesis
MGDLQPSGEFDLEAFDPAQVGVLIPAYLEEAHIAGVVRRVLKQVNSVLVVDDGSWDGTAACAREAGAEVVTHERNYGKGAAIKTGFRILLERGCSYILLLDGDGQHLPEEIARFLAAGAETRAGFIVGNRMGDAEKMPPVRRMTNQGMSWLISYICGQSIPDTQCGFRMIRRDVVPLLFCESNAYEYETEMLIIASRNGHSVVSVPVSTVYAGEQSKINPVRDGVRFLRLILRYLRE